jgi:hypothetical protein
MCHHPPVNLESQFSLKWRSAGGYPTGYAYSRRGWISTCSAAGIILLRTAEIERLQIAKGGLLVIAKRRSKPRRIANDKSDQLSVNYCAALRSQNQAA